MKQVYHYPLFFSLLFSTKTEKKKLPDVFSGDGMIACVVFVVVEGSIELCFHFQSFSPTM